MNSYYDPGYASAKKPRKDMLRIIGEYKYLTGTYLAVDGRYRSRLAEAELARNLKQAGVTRPGVLSIVAAARRALGTALIWTGQRLQGAATIAPAAG